MNQLLKDALKVNREQLKSVNIDEIIKLDEEKMTDEELMARAHIAQAFYNNYFKKVLKLFLFKQLQRLGDEAELAGQILYCRGTINGVNQLEEWFNKKIGIVKESETKDKTFDEAIEDNPEVGE